MLFVVGIIVGCLVGADVTSAIRKIVDIDGFALQCLMRASSINTKCNFEKPIIAKPIMIKPIMTTNS